MHPRQAPTCYHHHAMHAWLPPSPISLVLARRARFVKPWKTLCPSWNLLCEPVTHFWAHQPWLAPLLRLHWCRSWWCWWHLAPVHLMAIICCLAHPEACWYYCPGTSGGQHGHQQWCQGCRSLHCGAFPRQLAWQQNHRCHLPFGLRQFLHCWLEPMRGVSWNPLLSGVRSTCSGGRLCTNIGLTVVLQTSTTGLAPKMKWVTSPHSRSTRMSSLRTWYWVLGTFCSQISIGLLSFASGVPVDLC